MDQNQQEAFQVKIHIMEFHVLPLQWLTILKLDMFYNKKIPTMCWINEAKKQTKQKKI